MKKSNRRRIAAAGAVALLMVVLVFIAEKGYVAFSTGQFVWGIFIGGDTAKKNESPTLLLKTMRLLMLGPLAATPEPLQDPQIQEIKTQLDEAFANTGINSIGSNARLHPVLFVPGLESSQLETKLTNRKKPHWWLPCWFCETTTQDYQTIWFPMNAYLNLLPYSIDCYIEQILLRWKKGNDGTYKAHPWRPGIDTRPTPTFEAAMELGAKFPAYKPYADWLTQYFGYQPNQQMIAQTWDWRVGPETWMLPGREFDQMKKAIEQVVKKNQGKGIVAMSISAGGPFFALFLNRHVDQAWKDKHVHAFFSISGALSGSAIAPMQYISTKHNSFLPEQIPEYIADGVSRIVKTTSTISWLFPFDDSFHDTVISSPSKAYRAHELHHALEDAGYPEQAQLYLANRAFYGGTNLVPGVRTYCLSGFGIPTLKALHYGTDDMSDSPTFDLDDGDNCVTVESLRQCDAWAEQQEAPVHVQHFFNESHAGLLFHAEVVQKFFNVVAGKEGDEPPVSLG